MQDPPPPYYYDLPQGKYLRRHRRAILRLALLINLAAAIGLAFGDNALISGLQFGNSAMNRYLSLVLPAPMLPLGGIVSYQKFIGDGTPAQGWPDQSAWIDLQSMWQRNLDNLITKICDNSDEENTELLRAINSVSHDTGVDARFILAIVMEESRGCVRVGATSLAVTNPGLMQSYQGKGSCASPLQNPCPYSEILQMIRDGTSPNPDGEDLEDLLQRADTTNVSRYYKAARMYNSGQNSIPASGELSVGGANACYAADIANRLIGYIGESCGTGGVGGAGGSGPSYPAGPPGSPGKPLGFAGAALAPL